MASKTARASMRAGAMGGKGGFTRAIGSPRFIPTGGGKFAHVFLPDGSSTFVKVGSDDYVAAVASLTDAGDTVAAAEIEQFAARYPDSPWALPSEDVDTDEAAEEN